VITDNFDINLWDKVAYETDGERSGGWEMRAYSLHSRDGYVQHGDMLPYGIKLRARDIMRMGLDWEVDSDIWLDAQYVLEDYNTPRRVRRWIYEVLDELRR
jgi:hypothetical protein